MNLIISNASGKHIYEQIYTQVKNCIISGLSESYYANRYLTARRVF